VLWEGSREKEGGRVASDVANAFSPAPGSLKTHQSREKPNLRIESTLGGGKYKGEIGGFLPKDLDSQRTV